MQKRIYHLLHLKIYMKKLRNVTLQWAIQVVIPTDMVNNVLDELINYELIRQGRK